MSLRDNLAQDAVNALGMLDPVIVGADESVANAVALMQERSAGCVVIAEHGKAVGVFTERDVLTKVLAGNLPPGSPISEVMTPHPRVIEEGSSVAGVIRAMHDGGFRHMPVVDASGCVCGVVSVKRIVEYLVEHFPSTVFNLPPEPNQQQTAREGA